MLTLIIGGSASGKSEYAEQYVQKLDGSRIYLATMHCYDEESQKRIEKHRKARSGRGFQTVERETNLETLHLPPESNVLLEDLSNLLANECYGTGENTDRFSESAEDRCMAGISRLHKSVLHLTIVTNEIFSDGGNYEEETLQFMRRLASLNRGIASAADRVYEVVCQVPVRLK